MDTDAPPLPGFLIIGAQKSATRWLRQNLGYHPEVFAAEQEISFFNHPRRIDERGLTWYRQQFVGWLGEPIIGEATPGYMMPRHHPTRMALDIDRHLPGVRLMAILRNPLDRAQSALVHHVDQGRVAPDTSLTDYVRTVSDSDEQRLNIVEGGQYAACLTPYVDQFEDRLLVLFQDDIANDAKGLYTAALQHIGASADFVPQHLARVRYSNVAAKGESEPPPVPPLTDQDRADLWHLYDKDVTRLEELVGRDLSSWRPETGP
ncbi:MAG: sulfotransferase domain-containing protein [Acidimicrobiia bacterium]|nr:sulfotransferase domain-containing protein [Acidimicrobiia bacterium]